jgi:LacI family transcriptional regulator
MRAAGLPVSKREAVHDAATTEAAEAATAAMLRADNPPTALFTAQNLVTIGALRALRRLDVHREVALVGFDDFPLADLLDPPVTVVAQDPHTIGRLAAERLFHRIDGDTGSYVTEVVRTRLVRRGSGEIPPPQSAPGTLSRRRRAATGG